MESSEIRKIIRSGEANKTEFKLKIQLDTDAAKKEFARDLSAMANTRGETGRIIYGIRDTDLKPIGIKRERGLEESLVQIASSRIEPPVDFEPEWFEIDNVSILVLKVPNSEMRPHWIKETGDVYIRRHNVIEKIHPLEIMRLKESDYHDKDAEMPQESDDESFYPPNKGLVPVFFPLEGPPTLYRTCKRDMGEHLSRFEPVVFDPQYDNFVPTPEFGDTKSALAYLADRSSHSVSNADFEAFIRNLSNIVPRVAQSAGIWDDRIPMYWSLSGDNDMDYGVGAESALQALRSRLEGVLACVIHFGRFDYYKPTSLLLFYADVRAGAARTDSTVIDVCWLKLLTSSLPFNPKWIQDIFGVFRGIDGHFNPVTEITDSTLEEICSIEWSAKIQSRVKAPIIGFMGRVTNHSESKYDQSLGLVVKTEPFWKAEMSVDEDWNFHHYGSLFNKPPVKYFDEIPIEVTNPVPNWSEIQSGTGAFRSLRARQLVVGAAGRIMSVVSAYSAGGI